jgi:hypothetical protein
MPSPQHNPFRDLDLDALVGECQRIAADLQARRKRTAESRAKMAEDVSALLRVVACRLGVQRGAPGSPEYSISTSGNLPEAYLKYYLEELVRVRHAILDRAAALVLGAGASAWIRSLGCGVDGDAYARAVGSDAGLLKQLKALDKLRTSRLSSDAFD